MRLNLLERRMAKFMRQPPSVRLAAGTIVAATALAVVISGVLMRVFDHREYKNIWVGMWWAMQTVTTVGYGDVTPHRVSGRIIASFVMLEGIAFLAIITASVTATFVARAAAERHAAEASEELSDMHRIGSRLDELDRKLDRLTQAVHGSGES